MLTSLAEKIVLFSVLRKHEELPDHVKEALVKGEYFVLSVYFFSCTE